MPQSQRLGIEKTQSSLAWVAHVAIVLIAACNSDSSSTPNASAGAGAQPIGTGMSPVGTEAGAGAASVATAGTSASTAAGSSAGAAGRTGAAGTAAVSSSAGASATAGTPASAAGGGAGAGAEPAAAGSGGAAPSAIDLVDCMSGSVEPCRSITTSSGTKIDLGPYGSVMDKNMGAGFESTIASGDSDGGATCAGFTSLFGEDPAGTEMLLDTMDLKFDLYTVYRPANWVDGEKYPIITWGNGTCAQPEGYGPLLRYVASHGFVVVAANSRWVGSNGAMVKALDYIFAANEDSASPYFGRLDTTKVGAMGHSQGSGATATAASDARITSIILFNGGNTSSKPFFAVSGEMDIGSPSSASFKNAVDAATKGAFMYFHKVAGMGSLRGHLTLMTEPLRVTEPTTAWFKYTLSNDAESAKYFVGADCKLCNMPEEFDYGQKGLQ